MNDLLTIKNELYKRSKEIVENNIRELKDGLNALKEDAENETKSSVGDKYETGRAMIQLEMEKYSSQLDEAIKKQQQINRIKPGAINGHIEQGCLITTSQGNYYLAISLGKINIAGKDYFVISPASPIGLKLKDRKAGEEIEFNGNRILINSII